MYSQIEDLKKKSGFVILNTNRNSYHILMGMLPEALDPNTALYFLKMVAVAIHKMYTTVPEEREGIG